MHRRSIALAVVAALGLGIAVFPMAAGWVAAWQQRDLEARYDRVLVARTSSERTAVLEDALDYNRRLSTGRIHLTRPDMDLDYQARLQSGVGGRLNMMGTVVVPSIGVSLPVYHGTSAEILATGAGHVYGTSLPVGGAGTHAVISAHSGLASARLFTDLRDLVVGDLFLVEAAEQVLYYAVDLVEVVTPDRVDELKAVRGQDLVTLMTCTPIGVNSHRLLVRGVRTEAPAGAATASLRQGPGFPWWAVAFVGGVAATVTVSEVVGRRVGARNAQGGGHDGTSHP